MRPKLTLSGPVACEARSLFYPAPFAGKGYEIVKLTGVVRACLIPQIALGDRSIRVNASIAQ